MQPITQNTLFYGDNLQILKEYLPSESVDLIYLDPPFNSKRTYNILFKDEYGFDSDAQITAFEDSWHWDKIAAETFQDLITKSPAQVASMMSAFREMIGYNQMMAYLVMMAIRLVELHRVLKPTGSLYLHCDPTASHYLRTILDTIFGPEHFQNEIIWKRTSAHSDAKRCGRIHDVIFFYSKTHNYTWNKQFLEYDKNYIKRFYRNIDENGRRYSKDNLTADGPSEGRSGLPWRGIDVKEKGIHWKFTIDKLDVLEKQGRIIWPKKKDGVPRYKRFLDEVYGVLLQDIWTDIPPALGAQNLGYPTQKPVALLERIINASSHEGDWVLDPFCGCGTSIVAAQKLNRHWIGIDITHLAIALQKYRLKDMFKITEKVEYEVIGEPTTVSAANQLAQDNRYQFQWWALSLVKAKPVGGQKESKRGKKGKDLGIDGVINFLDVTKKGKPNRVLVQVKSGKVKSGDIRDLLGTVNREKAAIGVFITLEPATKDMLKEASAAGFYESPEWINDKFPKIQILTIEALLQGAKVKFPANPQTFKKAVNKKERNQLDLL